ncbi:MAG: hypothetical protein JO125_06815 [Chloroflexi bacterium]|nr:hypothetical protein [Ktedonobacteraceae bacterium]MBV9707102.1 hypothetical protein [Chloroflexota bacterium]
MSIQDCGGGVNGFEDISDNASGTVERSADLGNGVFITLEVSDIRGTQRGWAKIHGNTQPGDQVWMDWTTDGGSTWIQCGPWPVNTAGDSKTSAAQRTDPSPSWRFRAGGNRAGMPSQVTDWW